MPQLPPVRDEWRRAYWLAAFAPALALYGFEVAQVSLLEPMRAPNVSVAVQLLVMLGFFSLWALVPRAIWWTGARAETENAAGPGLALRLVLLGGALSAAHLFLLAVILRIFHSPPGWNVGHLMQSFAEVWIIYAGFWFALYGLACLVIVWFSNRRGHDIASKNETSKDAGRLEMRRNGRTHLLPAEDILWVEARGNYVELHTVRGLFTLRKSLARVEAELGSGFLRSHRGALVNTAHVMSVSPADAGRSYLIDLGNGAAAPLSRRRLSAFKQHLQSVSANR